MFYAAWIVEKEGRKISHTLEKIYGKSETYLFPFHKVYWISFFLSEATQIL